MYLVVGRNLEFDSKFFHFEGFYKLANRDVLMRKTSRLKRTHHTLHLQQGEEGEFLTFRKSYTLFCLFWTNGVVGGFVYLSKELFTNFLVDI